MALVACGALVVIVNGFAFATVPNVNEIESVDSSGDASNGNSQNPSVSGDNRYVVFESAASNLSPISNGGYEQIYVRDRDSNTTTMISTNGSGTAGNNDSNNAQISYGGRYIVYASSATNLVSGDGDGSHYQIYVYDMNTGTTALASSTSDGTEGNNSSSAPSIDADGQDVVFESYSTNLVSNVTSSSSTQVYEKDMVTGALKLVSVNPITGDPANNYGADVTSSGPAISCDGGSITFGSDATNLVSNDTNGYTDVFDLQTGFDGDILTDVTLDANSSSYDPVISCNGNDIAYVSSATNLIPNTTTRAGEAFEYNRLSQTNTEVSVSTSGAEASAVVYQPTISDDGRFVSFYSNDSNLDTSHSYASTTGNVYIRDVKNNTTQLVSLDLYGMGSGGVNSAAISPDGSYVAFSSGAEARPYAPKYAITSGDENGYVDVFMAETGF